MARPVYSILCLVFFAAFAAFGQTSVPITIAGDASRSARIATITRGGALYGSVNDLAGSLRLKTFTNPETQKLELEIRQYRLKVTAANPFVVISDQDRNANLAQLQRDVVLTEGRFFAPLEEFVRLLNDVLPEPITFERSRATVSVGRATSSSPFEVTGVTYEEKSNGDLIRIHCTKKLVDYESWTKPINDDTWLYVTLADAKADVNALRKYKATGALKQILVFQSPTSVQLTFRLKGAINTTELIPAERGNDILLSIHRPTPEQVAVRKARAYERSLERERNRWKLDVIVIDAGHGGDDPGTIGLSKTKEKDITLAIALKLGKLIEKHLPDVKVVHTRTSDTFVELYRRGQIANQAGGKLFLSIHCNSMPRKPHPTNGFEIYLLRPGKTESAIRIAERENAVVKMEAGYEQRYQQLTEENFILLTMAQNAYVKYSEQFADILQQEMGKNLAIANNGVKQAGFYVLVGASMPNVLIETAYLSNKDDEKVLKSPQGQQRIAEAIYSAVKRYKKDYERFLEEGREIGSGSH